MFSIFIQYYSKKFRRYFSSQTLARFITAFLFIAVFAALTLGIFLFFQKSFQFIIKDVFFREALLLYIYELFLLVSFLLIFASALISGIFTLFRGEKDFPLIVSPRFASVPFCKTVSIALTSSWPFLIIILPALTAIRSVFGLTAGVFLLSFLSVLMLAISAVLTAEVLLFLAGLALSVTGTNRLTLKNLSLLVALVFLAIIAVIWLRLQFIDFNELFMASILGLPTASLEPILHKFNIFPSHWSAITIFSSQRGNWKHGLIATLTSFGFSVIMAMFFYFLQKKFLTLWQILQENNFKAGVRALNHARHSSVLSRVSSPLSAIFNREAINFWRNTKGMLWLGFLLIIWAVQVASTFLLSHRLGENQTFPDTASAFVIILQLAVAIYFVSMFVLRFAFPAFSMEKKTAWLMRSAPVDWAKIFWGKLIFYASIFSGLGVFFAFLNRGVFFLSPAKIILFFTVVVFSSFVITVFGLGLGAIFPNFETDDPEVLSTTLPGLGFIAGTLLYGAFAAFALEEFLLKIILFPLGLWILLSLSVVYLFIHLSIGSLAQLEF